MFDIMGMELFTVNVDKINCVRISHRTTPAVPTLALNWNTQWDPYKVKPCTQWCGTLFVHTKAMQQMNQTTFTFSGILEMTKYTDNYDKINRHPNDHGYGPAYSWKYQVQIFFLLYSSGFYIFNDSPSLPTPPTIILMQKQWMYCTVYEAFGNIDITSVFTTVKHIISEIM